MKILNRFKNQIILLVIIVVSVMIIKNILKDFSQKMVEVENLQSEVDHTVTLLDRWGKLSKEYLELSDRCSFSEENFFYRFVEDVARNSKINLNSLTPSRLEKQYYTEVKVDLKISSSYENITNFIKTIEENSKITIDKLSMRQGDSEGMQIEMSLKGLVFKK